MLFMTIPTRDGPLSHINNHIQSFLEIFDSDLYRITLTQHSTETYNTQIVSDTAGRGGPVHIPVRSAVSSWTDSLVSLYPHNVSRCGVDIRSVDIPSHLLYNYEIRPEHVSVISHRCHFAPSDTAQGGAARFPVDSLLYSKCLELIDSTHQMCDDVSPIMVLVDVVSGENSRRHTMPAIVRDYIVCSMTGAEGRETGWFPCSAIHIITPIGMLLGVFAIVDVIAQTLPLSCNGVCQSPFPGVSGAFWRVSPTSLHDVVAYYATFFEHVLPMRDALLELGQLVASKRGAHGEQLPIVLSFAPESSLHDALLSADFSSDSAQLPKAAPFLSALRRHVVRHDPCVPDVHGEADAHMRSFKECLLATDPCLLSCFNASCIDWNVRKHTFLEDSPSCMVDLQVYFENVDRDSLANVNRVISSLRMRFPRHYQYFCSTHLGITAHVKKASVQPSMRSMFASSSASCKSLCLHSELGPGNLLEVGMRFLAFMCERMNIRSGLYVYDVRQLCSLLL